MANHKSSERRIRQSLARKLHNRYRNVTMRNAVKDLRKMTSKEEAQAKFPTVASLLDKLASKGLLHKNKAANLKSKLARHIQKLA